METLTQTKYIRTTRELVFEDHKGRTTHLIENLPGIIIDEANIYEICDNEKEREKCYRLLEMAKQRGGDGYLSLLLVQGYLCLVPPEWFVICDQPKMYPVPFEII